jgi:hypothetical protein
LWGTGSAAFLLDETDLAIRLLQDAMQRLRAPGVRGASGTALTGLGWAYIDAGRWDDALEAAAEAACLAEANYMGIVAASADVISATVLALRGDSAAARRHADRALAAVDPAECGLVASRARRFLGVAALADGSHLQAFTQLRGLFSDDGTPLHNYASYLGVADLAAAAVRADRRIEGQDVLERALGSLHGIASLGSNSSSPTPAGSSPARPVPKPTSARRSPTPPGTSGPSSGPSFSSTTPNGCGVAAGSTTPNLSLRRPWPPSGCSGPGPGRSAPRQSSERAGWPLPVRPATAMRWGS